MRIWCLIIVMSGVVATSGIAAADKLAYKCSTLSRMIEAEEGLPPLLLSAITFVESSDMPWVVGVKGATHRFKTRKAAIAKIEELKRKGDRNFDIGCMQVNYHYHHDKFRSMEDMLNPVRNIRYAAKLLKRLYKETGSWETAVAYYNTRHLELSRPYKNKVYAHWDSLKSQKKVEIAELPEIKVSPFVDKSTISTAATLHNTTLHRARLAYLNYRKSLVR